jgi:hypothetical protein
MRAAGAFLHRKHQKTGWEAWTRTRIARSRVWSPTNWTTSQWGGTKTNRSTFPLCETAAILLFYFSQDSHKRQLRGNARTT